MYIIKNGYLIYSWKAGSKFTGTNFFLWDNISIHPMELFYAGVTNM